jgi:hypothetical protein
MNINALIEKYDKGLIPNGLTLRQFATDLLREIEPDRDDYVRSGHSGERALSDNFWAALKQLEGEQDASR